jgi:uncharacterized peroxidase-related enzyme
MVRDDERRSRAAESPLVGSLPDMPGILAAMNLTPGLATHLRGLADELLVRPFPGSTLSRAERELLATSVSAGNDCFYCMDSHGAFATQLMRKEGPQAGDAPVVDALKVGRTDGLEPRLQALVPIAQVVRANPRQLSAAEVSRAKQAGATDGDVQLTVLIASAFCMYNRMVDGLRARTPPSAEAFRERAAQIAEHGYSGPQVTAVPR